MTVLACASGPLQPRTVDSYVLLAAWISELAVETRKPDPAHIALIEEELEARGYRLGEFMSSWAGRQYVLYALSRAQKQPWEPTDRLSVLRRRVHQPRTIRSKP